MAKPAGMSRKKYYFRAAGSDLRLHSLKWMLSDWTQHNNLLRVTDNSVQCQQNLQTVL